MSDLTVIVVGANAVASGLLATGQVSTVHAVSDLNELKSLLQSPGMSRTVTDKVFVLSDTVSSGSGPSLTMFVPKLLALGAQVVVLAETPLGVSVTQASPGAHLVSAPVYLNTMLGALSSLPNVAGFTAVPDSENILVFGGDTAPATPSGQEYAAPSASSGTVTPPTFGAPPQFGTPPPFGAQATPASPVPPPMPAPEASPQFSEGAPGTGAPARRRRSLADMSTGAPDNYAGNTSNPFAGSPNPFASAQPGPANPFGAPQGPYPSEPAAPLSQNGYPAQGQFPGQGAPGRRGFVITVTAPKGGTGKSSLSLNLAAYLGLRLRGTGRNVCLIDANVQQADSGKYLNAYTPNVEDVLRDPSSVTPDRITNYLLHRPQLNLSVLLGPSTPDAANPTMFSGRRYSQILEALKPNFDYIIIDTPVAEFYHDMFRTFALPNADFIAVAVTPNVTTLINTDMWLRQITAPVAAGGMGIPESRIGVVLNRAEKDIGFNEDEVRQNLAEWRYLGQIPETKEWKASNNRGELVVIHNYQELNSAFGNILSQVTGEQLQEQGGSSLGGGKGGGLLGLFKRKK